MRNIVWGVLGVGLFLFIISWMNGWGNPFRESGHMMNGRNASMNMGHMQNEMNGHMDHGSTMSLNSSKGINEVAIPPLLNREKGKEYDYEIRAQRGTTSFFNGSETETFGYNGSFLGPTVVVQEGESVKIKVKNELEESTTFHWHGLEIPGNADGGPHNPLNPGESDTITIKGDQPESTLWYHPHPHKNTAEQVFKGLAGMLYIKGDNKNNLPEQYGVNDIPLIFQDRQFDEYDQLNYRQLNHSDGTLGNISLVNGTMDPKFTVTEPVMRFRLLNGSNARNYTFRLSNGESFLMVGSDGGSLNQPVALNELTLSPSERAEILIDFSKMDLKTPISIMNEEGSELLPFRFAIDSNKKESIPTFKDAEDSFITDEEKNLPVTKKLELFGMMKMVSINGKKFDPNRIDLKQEQGVTEVWEVYNKPDHMGGMIHPFHIHGTQFKIISRDGQAPPVNEEGLKDNVLIRPGEKVKLLVTFPKKGVYMYHCHILEHEDNGMMGQVEVY